MKLPLRLRALTMGLIYGLVLGVLSAVVTPVAPAFAGYLQRPACADKIVSQLVTIYPVKGSRDCLGGAIGYQAEGLGITTDGQLAARVGRDGGSYYYRGQTADGGYVYEVRTEAGVSTIFTIYTRGDGRVTDIR